MESSRYVYGMRLRGFSIGTQPEQGFLKRLDDPEKKYHDLLVYDRKLSQKEMEDYELDEISPEHARNRVTGGF